MNPIVNIPLEYFTQIVIYIHISIRYPSLPTRLGAGPEGRALAIKISQCPVLKSSHKTELKPRARP